MSRRRLQVWLECRVQYYDDNAHVVARTQDQAVIDQFLANGAQIPRPFLLRWRRHSGRAIWILPLQWWRWRWRATIQQEVADFVNDCLRRHDIPDAVTGKDHKLVLLRVARLHNHLRKRGHSLCRSVDGLTALVHKVAESTRHRQVAIYAIEFDGPARRLDPSLLLWIHGLVIVRQRHRLPSTRKHCARVARISAYNVLGSNERHN
mmetsp:Transcript_36488/g.117160  ORF Transcript_36488/g.117160 Transcript_36488/m.117160 type:complete len:206 (+) Transcript_36488:661-1278(+)